MADKKISALDVIAALDGTERVPLVQGGTTKSASLAEIRGGGTVAMAADSTVGNGSADDTDALQAVFDSGATMVLLGYGRTYKITDTITVPAQVSVDFQTSTIRYYGTRDRPAIIVGESGTLNYATIANARVIANTIDWSDTDFVGIRAMNMCRTTIHVLNIFGFTIGYELYSLGTGYTHVKHELIALTDCKYGTALTSDGADSYVNENVFIGGDTTSTSNVTLLGSCYGVWFRAINSGYTGNNGNKWFGPCFQPSGGQEGDEGIPFFFDECGGYNTVIAARHESGRGPFAKLVNTGADKWIVFNQFDVLISEGTYVNLAIEEVGNARFNVLTSPLLKHTAANNEVSVDIFRNVYAVHPTFLSLTGPLALTDTTGTLYQYLSLGTGLKQRKESFSINAAVTIGFITAVGAGDQFVLTSNCEAGYYGRLGVMAYDANMTRLTDGSATYPDVLASPDGGDLDTYVADFGGSYKAGADAAAFSFQVSSAVKYIRVFIANGTTAARVKSLSLRRLNSSTVPLVPFSGLDHSPVTRYATESPNYCACGIYVRGDFIHSLVAYAAAPSGWTAQQGGRGAPAWANSTAYTVGDIVQNDGFKVYVCVTAGTSAGSGGPTGTGAAITDGGVTWDYYTLAPFFTPGPTIPA